MELALNPIKKLFVIFMTFMSRLHHRHALALLSCTCYCGSQCSRFSKLDHYSSLTVACTELSSTIENYQKK